MPQRESGNLKSIGQIENICWNCCVSTVRFLTCKFSTSYTGLVSSSLHHLLQYIYSITHRKPYKNVAAHNLHQTEKFLCPAGLNFHPPAFHPHFHFFPRFIKRPNNERARGKIYNPSRREGKVIFDTRWIVETFSRYFYIFRPECSEGRKIHRKCQEIHRV